MALFGRNPLRRIGRENRVEARQEGKLSRAEAKQRLKNLPREHLEALAQLSGEAHQEQYGGGGPSGMAPYGAGSSPQMASPGQLIGSPIGGRAPYGIGPVTTSVPANGSAISLIPGLASPSFFRTRDGGRLLITPNNLPAGISGFLLAITFGTINQLGSLAGSGFDAYNANGFGLEIAFADIVPGYPVSAQAQLFNSTGAAIDVTWGITLYGDRLG